MKSPIFKKPDGGKFEISIQALKSMLFFVQDTPGKTEAGGVLLGRHIIESTDMVVDEITVPTGKDRRGRNCFRRDRSAHQTLIDNAWRDSGCTCAYLGEWHTHAEDNPTPSGVDLRDWRRKLRKDVFEGHCLYFIIVGTRRLGVWEATRQGFGCVFLGDCNHFGGEFVEHEYSI
ncbi:MAG: Mov34/MPN/PAD-1 family protein [Chloroflexi bacterium]|nr:Mov34/MPN/PAD-1 family protein [Chloroflexota bacterium]